MTTEDRLDAYLIAYRERFGRMPLRWPEFVEDPA